MKSSRSTLSFLIIARTKARAIGKMQSESFAQNFQQVSVIFDSLSANASSVSGRQFVATQNRAHLFRGKLRGWGLRERRLRPGRTKVVRRFVIDRQLRLERKRKLIGASWTLRTGENPFVAFATESKRPCALFRFRAIDELNRFEQSPTAETDIRQPRFSIRLHFQRHVRARPNLIGAEAHARRESRKNKTRSAPKPAASSAFCSKQYPPRRSRTSFVCKLSRSRRIDFPSRISRFSNGMCVVCARCNCLKAAAVTFRDPEYSMRSRYASRSRAASSLFINCLGTCARSQRQATIVRNYATHFN